MGISSSEALPHLLYLAKENGAELKGSILQLGRQDVYFDYDVLQSQADRFALKLKSAPIRRVENPWSKDLVIDDETLFSALGFETVESLDFVADENPTFVYNLNEDVPKDFHGRWNVVFDGGTLEHVFDVATAFRNIHAMIKPGGLAIHENPTNHYVDHGFWQINPTVLFDFYSANGYEILGAWVCLFKSADNIHHEIPRRFIYDPAAFEPLSFGGFPNGLASVFFVARKPWEEKPAVKPTQGFYRRHWNIDRRSQQGGTLNGLGGVLALESIKAA